jgi:hypothetical protein
MSEVLATRLDARGRQPGFVRMLEPRPRLSPFLCPPGKPLRFLNVASPEFMAFFSAGDFHPETERFSGAPSRPGLDVPAAHDLFKRRAVQERVRSVPKETRAP